MNILYPVHLISVPETSSRLSIRSTREDIATAQAYLSRCPERLLISYGFHEREGQLDFSPEFSHRSTNSANRFSDVSR